MSKASVDEGIWCTNNWQCLQTFLYCSMLFAVSTKPVSLELPRAESGLTTFYDSYVSMCRQSIFHSSLPLPRVKEGKGG